MWIPEILQEFPIQCFFFLFFFYRKRRWFSIIIYDPPLMQKKQNFYAKFSSLKKKFNNKKNPLVVALTIKRFIKCCAFFIMYTHLSVNLWRYLYQMYPMKIECFGRNIFYQNILFSYNCISCILLIYVHEPSRNFPNENH